MGRRGTKALDAAAHPGEDVAEGGRGVECKAVAGRRLGKDRIRQQIAKQGHGGFSIDGAGAVREDATPAKVRFLL